MAIKNKVGKHTTIALIAIALCFISILCCGILSSCEASSSETKRLTIDASELIAVKGTEGKSFVFVKFEYEGHQYFGDPLSGNSFMMHSPNCPCLEQSQLKSSSVFDSPSSSLFNW